MARVALYMDVENLVHDLREVGDFDGATSLVGEIVRQAELRGLAVAKVACCDPSLARRMAFGLAEAGVRTFTHGGGTDVADLRLIAEIEHGLPASADTVVIASGDHIFAEAATALRAKGKAVVVIAREGSLSAQLALAADDVVKIRSGHAIAA